MTPTEAMPCHPEFFVDSTRLDSRERGKKGCAVTTRIKWLEASQPSSHLPSLDTALHEIEIEINQARFLLGVNLEVVKSSVQYNTVPYQTEKEITEFDSLVFRDFTLYSSWTY